MEETGTKPLFSGMSA